MKTKRIETKNIALVEREKNLIAVMQNGTEAQASAAFNELYSNRYEGIHNWLKIRLNGNATEADDLVQEVFLKVHLGINSFRPENAFSTWLYTIARNCFIDSKRKTNIDVISVDGMYKLMDDGSDSYKDTSFQLADKSGETGHELFMKKENKRIIHNAIEQLKKPKMKQVMTLKYMHDLSIKEIAKRMNIAEGTVKALGFRGEGVIGRYLNEIGFQYQH